MKTLFTLLILSLALVAEAITPFNYQFNNADGSANTNVALMTAWPPVNNTFVVVGTNIVYGGTNLVLTPNASGFGTNQIFAGSYRVFFTNLNFGFFVSIADVTNQLPLASYLSAVPVFFEPISYYGLVTNWLAFAPATNGYGGIVAALGMAPATNSNGGIIFALGYVPSTNTTAGIEAALGFVPMANSLSGLTNSIGYWPVTNTFSGILAALGYMPATNGGAINISQLGFAPATNTVLGIVNALGFTPMTNSYNALTNALGYTPRTNDGYTGLPNIVGISSVVTNGPICWVTYKTNGNPGAQFTNLPWGSICSTTNGSIFILSNLVWTIR